ncbi:hypothetical protein D3C77_594190 [compost metagenome]
MIVLVQNLEQDDCSALGDYFDLDDYFDSDDFLAVDYQKDDDFYLELLNCLMQSHYWMIVYYSC